MLYCILLISDFIIDGQNYSPYLMELFNVESMIKKEYESAVKFQYSLLNSSNNIRRMISGNFLKLLFSKNLYDEEVCNV